MSKPFKVQDKYFIKAKQKGYRARSVFKLEEMQNKFNIFKKGMKVLDLGAAPGSWLQLARQLTGEKAQLIGIDLEWIESIAGNVVTWQGDIFSKEAEEFINNNGIKEFDIILSDMAPATSGVKEADQARSVELADRVSELSDKFLKIGGTMVVKVFQGKDFQDWVKGIKIRFNKVNIFKPKASRDRSFEVYVIARK